MLIFSDCADSKDRYQKDYVSGITFSGGDPLSPVNRKEILEMIQHFRLIFPEKTIWLYTGYVWEEIAHLTGIRDVDVVVDGRYVHSQRNTNLPYRGSYNQRIIDVKESLRQDKTILKHAVASVDKPMPVADKCCCG